jgi:hypothetical protein
MALPLGTLPHAVTHTRGGSGGERAPRRCTVSAGKKKKKGTHISAQIKTRGCEAENEQQLANNNNKKKFHPRPTPLSNAEPRHRAQKGAAQPPKATRINFRSAPPPSRTHPSARTLASHPASVATGSAGSGAGSNGARGSPARAAGASVRCRRSAMARGRARRSGANVGGGINKQRESKVAIDPPPWTPLFFCFFFNFPVWILTRSGRM